MVIVGFSLKKILAEKFEPIKGKLKVDVKMSIRDITKEEIKVGAQEAIKISFSFSILYDPKIADLILEGELIFVDDPKKIKKILDSWKEKKVDEEIRVNVFNFLMNRCNIKALAIEEELNLPFHLPLPRVKQEKEK
ncbi:MAG: hypothetical protein QXP53_01785 [Candidatus Pacearchaeota archaeon]